MQNKSILILCFFLLSLSCDEGRKKKKFLSENTGKQHEIILVMDDNLWNGSKGEILRKVFEKEISGLPQSEQFFNLIHINSTQFGRLFRTHKNIMFVSNDVKDSYSKNKWAKSQIVMYLNSSSNNDIFKNTCDKTLNYLDRKEIENIKYSYQKGHNKKARLHIKDSFGFDMFLPTEYTISLKDKSVFISDFHSFSEKQDLLKYIVIHEFFPSSYDIQQEIIIQTDSILKEYILGAEKGSYVQIDKRIPLSERDGIYRGMWKLENGFMGGPFVLKTRYIGERIVVSLGLVFYPNEKKRNHVRTFEAIL